MKFIKSLPIVASVLAVASVESKRNTNKGKIDNPLLDDVLGIKTADDAESQIMGKGGLRTTDSQCTGEPFGLAYASGA